MKTPTRKKPAAAKKVKAKAKPRVKPAAAPSRAAKPAAKPVRKPAKKQAAAQPQNVTPIGSATTTPMVLVVDDYEDAREMYSEYLQFAGFRTCEAKTGLEALVQAASVLPDIILMDLSLPEMDGWEATRRLKAAIKTRHIPVVALTGHALAGHSEAAKDAGCDAFVAKPCLPEDLVVEVRRVLAQSQSRKSPSRARAR